MNLPFYISKRYLFSKKSQNVINIISGISVIGVVTGTMALIVILSVFNGFDELIKSLYSTFDPEIKIILTEGKTFSPSAPGFSQKYLRRMSYYGMVTDNILQQ
jgi:lipoprotein-releasing system permease protein